jgi:hypothetical protein
LALVENAPGSFNMQTFGLWHWTILGTIVVLNAIPISKILGRVGLSKWWTIAFLIPFVNLVALWIFANARWPALNRATVAPEMPLRPPISKTGSD